jgi:hypothetical protein
VAFHCVRQLQPIGIGRSIRRRLPQHHQRPRHTARTVTRVTSRGKHDKTARTRARRRLIRRQTRNEGVHRRADSCDPNSSFLRHRVRRRWRSWEDIGASGPILDWIRHGIKLPFRHGRPPPAFHQGVSLWDATPEQLAFLDQELARFLKEGHWEDGVSSQWVSRCFLVPKSGGGWRLVVDLRRLNTFFPKKFMKMETLKRLRHLARKGDWFFSFDLIKDGFYAMGIAPEDRQYFTVDIRGKLYQLAGLPMGWSVSPYYFQQLTSVFVRYFRRPAGCLPASSPPGGIYKGKSGIGVLAGGY